MNFSPRLPFAGQLTIHDVREVALGDVPSSVALIAAQLGQCLPEGVQLAVTGGISLPNLRTTECELHR
jgi:hypothetical protein